MKKLIAVALYLISGICAYAQVPDTDVYLVAISRQSGKITFGTPVNITNKDGYDNQPIFSRNNDKVIYVSMTDTSQTDVYEYDIKNETSKVLAVTSESEYSPMYIPDSNWLSVVRVDADKSQYLYGFEESPAHAEKIVEGIDSVGYYKWINDSLVALAVLNNGMELYVYELPALQFVVVDKNIGRCFMIEPTTGNLLYTKPQKDGQTTILMMDKTSLEVELFANGLGAAEDYLITPKGELWVGNEGKLYAMDPKVKGDWKEIADFSESIGSFYRITMSSDGKYLALVAYKGEKP